jgi:signal peptide peptidase SppA
MSYLAHIADRVLNRPLMIMPDKLAIISSVLEGRLGVEAVAPTADVPIPDASRHVGTYEIDPASSTGAKKPYRTTADGTAIIPVIGSLVGRGGWIQSMSGVQSYENIKFSLAAAANDPTVKAIILDIDSPGGEAVGAFEAADAVRAAAAKKEVIAVATGLCCSAAYAIASAASTIITTKSSVIGSIGVVMLHADYSHKLHEAGVVPTLIHAGKRKVDGSPYKPLTDDVKASLKAEVEKFNSLFVATVAEGRKSLTAEAIMAMEAGTYIGADAVTAGLADAVGSLESVLARLGSGGRAPGHSRGSSLQLAVPAAAKPAGTAPGPATIPTKPISAPRPPAPAGASWNDVTAEINGKKPFASAIGNGWDAVVTELNRELRR